MKKLEEFESCAQRLKALADPERLRIVDCLFGGPKNVGELSTLLKDEVVKVSHHLGVLRHAGLVLAKKEGRFVVYSLHPDIKATPQAGSNKQVDLGCCRIDLAASGK
jgi:DNA-binding transcriptional ArsR family regulator